MRLIGNEENTKKVVFEIYKRMYNESEPKADFMKLHEEGVTMIPNWFMEYYLPMERQNEIIDEVVKEFDIQKNEVNKLRMEIMLGCSPNSFQKNKLKEVI